MTGDEITADLRPYRGPLTIGDLAVGDLPEAPPDASSSLLDQIDALTDEVTSGTPTAGGLRAYTDAELAAEFGIEPIKHGPARSRHTGPSAGVTRIFRDAALDDEGYSEGGEA